MSAQLPGPGPFKTIPNLVTVVRTVAATALGLIALGVDDRVPWLIAGYLTYWLGDSLDGLLARLLHQETRAGAVFDICSDRLCTAILACGLALEQPHLVVPIAIFLLNFMVVDNVLSLSFLLWPIVSPNYFGQVDQTVFRYNWSHPAKALNNVGIVVAVVIGNLWLALVIVLAQLAVKIVSAVKVARLSTHRESVA
ncbi:CDP-alcohol phosphatidyltransferase family protein [Aeromicrobium phragmitis]|uniref:CDP-alcohol phosphatidyltransferase family protein n=1 Tax=Aeromicrobium phragmitis TaxID=2478914 RepID=A0A3L8PQS8_9ACTN|nr:CDP-alcohol phosphatidyltransferase family protein [Aeromicrobium phragmitis]RLV56818.1 CDP-alcohol phosphatidyltransferase family protein [Aeromicrobium phragmitis]